MKYWFEVFFDVGVGWEELCTTNSIKHVKWVTRFKPEGWKYKVRINVGDKW